MRRMHLYQRSNSNVTNKRRICPVVQKMYDLKLRQISKVPLFCYRNGRYGKSAREICAQVQLQCLSRQNVFFLFVYSSWDWVFNSVTWMFVPVALGISIFDITNQQSPKTKTKKQRKKEKKIVLLDLYLNMDVFKWMLIVFIQSVGFTFYLTSHSLTDDVFYFDFAVCQSKSLPNNGHY